MKKSNLLGILCAGILVAVSWPASDASAAFSTFDNDPEGWSVVDLPTPTIPSPPTVLGTYSVNYMNSGGNPGGYISMTDPSGNWFMFSAPNAFLGDQSSAFGGTLFFDMKTTPTPLPNEFPAVVLVGLEDTLFYTALAPVSDWGTYEVLLSPNGWRLNDQQSGLEPSALGMQTILSDLQALYISGDWIDGVETTGLDNVRLTPIPPAVWLFGSGLLGLAGIARRKKSAL
jgi:hypothetical protein